MKKQLLTGLSAILLASGAYADELGSSLRFIGLEIGAGQVQGKTLTEPGHEGDAIEYGIRIGAQDGQWRTTFLFDYFDSSDDDQNVEKGMLTVDYFFLEESSTVRPFIGVNLGYANYESTFVDDSGILYGGQVGIVVGLTENIDLDLSFRYSLSEIDVMDHSSEIMLGVNYLF